MDPLPPLDIDAVRKIAPWLVPRAAIYNTLRLEAKDDAGRELAARALDAFLRSLRDTEQR